MPSIKIVNGSEHVFSVEEAARRLKGLGLKVTETEQALGIPFDVDFPFRAGARSSDSSMILEVRGTYCDLLKLAREVA
jgi:hypothetical protein